MRTNDSQFAAATRAHAHRVAGWSGEIARSLGLPPPDQELLRETAIAHHYPLDCLEESGLARLGRDIGVEVKVNRRSSSKPQPAVYALLQAMRTSGFSSSRVQLLAGIIEVANFWDEQLEFAPFGDQPHAGLLERTIAAGQQIGFSPELLDGLTKLKITGPSALEETLDLFPSIAPAGLFSLEQRPCPAIRDIFLSVGLRSSWEHSLTGARLMARLAEESGRVAAADAFTAGLVHDIGRALIAMMGPAVCSTLERLHLAGCKAVAAELPVCGFDHAEAGARILERWELPGYLVQAVRWHHEPERDSHPVTGLLYLMERYTGSSEDLDSTVRFSAALRSAGLAAS